MLDIKNTYKNTYNDNINTYNNNGCSNNRHTTNNAGTAAFLTPTPSV